MTCWVAWPRGAQLPEFRKRPRALITPLEVRVDGDLIGDRQLLVVKGMQPTPCVRAGENFHHILAS